MKYILQVEEDGQKPFHLLQAQEDGTYQKIGILWNYTVAKELVAEANYSSTPTENTTE